MNSARTISLNVNGVERAAHIENHELLIDVLRSRFELTGTKEGCGVGVCGICAVLMDGKLVSACLTPAVLTNGSSVVTIEGLGDPNGKLTRLQEEFIRLGGFQCGICTPGQIVSATALLEEMPDPTPAQAKEWMMGSLCRCTGYEGILAAITAASADR